MGFRNLTGVCVGGFAPWVDRVFIVFCCFNFVKPPRVFWNKMAISSTKKKNCIIQLLKIWIGFIPWPKWIQLCTFCASAFVLNYLRAIAMPPFPFICKNLRVANAVLWILGIIEETWDVLLQEVWKTTQFLFWLQRVKIYISILQSHLCRS